jgi:hypothetical protein
MRDGKRVPAVLLDFCGDFRSLERALAQNSASEVLKIEGTPARQILPERIVEGWGKEALRRLHGGWFWKIWFAEKGSR